MHIRKENHDYCEGPYNGLDEEEEARRAGGMIADRDNIYVVDTSVLINDPNVFYKLGRNRIIVPLTVVKELDGLTRNQDPRRARALLSGWHPGHARLLPTERIHKGKDLHWRNGKYI